MGNWTLFWLLSYAGFTYLLADPAARASIACICAVCAFQSVMFDSHTYWWATTPNVASRAARAANSTPPIRAATAWTAACVQVCPTGIDIRNGLQYRMHRLWRLHRRLRHGDGQAAHRAG